MSTVARGAAANYQVMTHQDLVNLPVAQVTAPDAILAFWVPSSLLQEGLEIMNAWGFRQTQTWIWVKTKQDPGTVLKKQLRTKINKGQINKSDAQQIVDQFDYHQTLNFGMGHLFRQCHELVMLGVKGKPYRMLKNKSQRSISFAPATKHSVKPGDLQDRLELMFPDAQHKLELFGRRSRPGWSVLGNESPMTFGEDVTLSLGKLNKLTVTQAESLEKNLKTIDANKLKDFWSCEL